MTQPRSQLVDLTLAGTFHCVNRYVRRYWLCGLDKYTGKSFEHRKFWVEARILELGNIFACGVHAWAVMSNHLHIVKHMSPATASASELFPLSKHSVKTGFFSKVPVPPCPSAAVSAESTSAVSTQFAVAGIGAIVPYALVRGVPVLSGAFQEC